MKMLFDLLPPRLQGALDFHLRRRHIAAVNPPLNGQEHRQRMFREIVHALQPQAVIETGTFRASSTEYMHTQTGVRLWTGEASPRYYAFASRRLSAYPLVSCRFGDSRGFLRDLAVDTTVPKERVFFYLDAHWKQDLPLQAEVDIIVSHWKHVAIMVDDFEVPDDAGYGFDDYGPGLKLHLPYFVSLEQLGLWPFFPAVRAEQETGKRRGSVVLVDQPALEWARAVASIREWQR